MTDTAPGTDPAGLATETFWSRPAAELMRALGSSPGGLTSAEAARRLSRHGPNRVGGEDALSVPRLLLRQFESPLVLILIFGAGISLALAEWVDAGIILTIVLGSTVLGFAQEYRAGHAIRELRGRLALSTRVVRDGVETSVQVEALVPGDVVLLSAGQLVPADSLLLAAKDFLVSEASLTGESFPVEKRPGLAPADAPLARRDNMVFAGSSVRSGTARALVATTGVGTAFGAIAARLASAETETDFARGVRRFGGLLVRVMVVIVLAVLTVNAMLGRPFVDSLLFAVALAVGLSPELLPAIISVTLAAGARDLARHGVIVRRLEAIENLGSIDVLCTDKTGTLTQGIVVLDDAVDADGRPSAEVRRSAFLNASLETGIENPLDAAIVAACARDGLMTGTVAKIDEIPYDFTRRRLTIAVAQRPDADLHHLITKGAFANVLAICEAVAREGRIAPLDGAERARLEAYFKAKGEAGFRVLALADRELRAKGAYDRDDETAFVFRGFLLFRDPPKPDAQSTIAAIAALGVRIKIISGDNRYVTAHLAEEIGLDPRSLLTGDALAAMSEEALWHVAPRTDLFVEIDPQQKERIVRALQRAGYAVGYMGDGINDAPALHAADIGISVKEAVDVARESADVVLLERDLGVLRQGIVDGRRTFANTLKYISITTSANFGNMVSMAAITPFLPFLPLLPKQILLNNFLSDLPSMAISTDNVDREHVERPQRWDVRQLQRHMLIFGLISSCFDVLTFGALLFVLGANAATFQTIWFVVSLLTELGVVLILRTRGPAYRSRPSRLLVVATVGVFLAAVTLPYTGSFGRAFGFVVPGPVELATALAIVAGYLAATEAAKLRFFVTAAARP
jgi:Mg2+-importing ATPase